MLMWLGMQNPDMVLKFQEKFKFEKERWILKPLENRIFHLFHSISWDSEVAVRWFSYYIFCFRLNFMYNHISRLYSKTFTRKLEKLKNALGLVLKCFQTTNSNSCPGGFRILKNTIPAMFSSQILSCLFITRYIPNTKKDSDYTMIKS